MISRRTGWLVLLAALLLVLAGVLFHQRQAICADVPHGFARRAPIQGASGTDTFVCRAMTQHIPPLDIAVIAACWLSWIAVLRSAWIDIERVRSENRRLKTERDRRENPDLDA